MTIAFSLKSNMWTTEYSFESTCYGMTDNRMLSFKNVERIGRPTGGPVKLWLHDESPNRNLFYLEKYPSKISVVSNEDPSATKAYEAVSLETLYSSWSMDVATHEQEGSTDEFNEKENDQYAAIPKDRMITAANLTYVGTASGDQLTSDSLLSGRIVLSTMSGRLGSGILCYRNKADGVTFIDSLARDGGIASIDSTGRRRYVVGANEDVIEERLQCRSIDAQTKTLTLSNVPASFSVQPSLSEPEESDFYTRGNQVEIWIASPGSGESMKGDYIVVDLETPAGPDNFELYAINVDQHKVNLDHSLGQNN